jgi:hypothetical protein
MAKPLRLREVDDRGIRQTWYPQRYLGAIQHQPKRVALRSHEVADLPAIICTQITRLQTEAIQQSYQSGERELQDAAKRGAR